MKITFLLPHVRISGGVKAILEYANRLLARGHEVTLVLPPARPKWHHSLTRWFRQRNASTELAPSSVDWFRNDAPILSLGEFDGRNFPDADILIATAWQTAEFARQLPASKGKGFYFIQHYESLWTREKKRAEQTYRLPFQKIVISTWLKEILRERFQQSAEVLVTPVNRNDFFCEEKKWNHPPRVCLLHHNYDWKGYQDGIEAIRRVKSQNREIQLVVFGEKVENPRPLYEKAGFMFEYHYRPTGDSLRKIYASCDIYLCPSWHEGLGMPAMEAMACGCALVTTDTGGCRDYAVHDQTALVSPARSPEALANNLAAVMEDESLLKRLAEAGKEKVLTFDWDQNCDRLVEWFQQ